METRNDRNTDPSARTGSNAGHRLRGPLAAGIGALFVLAAPPSARADSVNVQTYSPPANSRYTLLESATPELLEGSSVVAESYQRIFFSMTYNYLSDPLVRLDATHTYRTGLLVDHVQTMDVVAGA